jgi:hypothetical protein
MFETFFNETPATATLPVLFAALGTAFVLGLLVSFVYMKTHKNKNPSQSFVFTLVLLPTVIAVIIFLVGNNVARAFSLAGAFSIIRFRSAPGDPKDITYVLFSMAVGLAAGMGFILYAVIVGAALCAIMALLELCKYGHPRGTEKTLKITMPENLNFQHAFDDILQKYTLSFALRKIKTVDMGSLYELNYAIVMKNGTNEKEFIDELRCRNGNLNIILSLDAPANVDF